ncbi:hypothetical protein KBB49_03210 [Candidatus Saccharibacteria bacterium]|nr:hypothetical protein [Candidatus Saccharibacteria bacterium]
MKSFNATKKIPTTHVYRNHLELIHQLIGSFTQSNKEYSAFIFINGKNTPLEKAKKKIFSKAPKSLAYDIRHKKSDARLLIIISDGIILNLGSASYELYGFFHELNDELNAWKIPKIVWFIRKFWLFSLFFSILFIPILVSLTLRNVGFVVFWFILCLVVFMKLFVNIFENQENWPDWDDVTLNTKIEYQVFKESLGSPLYSVLTSMKSVILFLAALATVVSTIFLIWE